jgi:hypothetical protein
MASFGVTVPEKMHYFMISSSKLAKSKIGDRLGMFNSKEHPRPIADLQIGEQY